MVGMAAADQRAGQSSISKRRRLSGCRAKTVHAAALVAWHLRGSAGGDTRAERPVRVLCNWLIGSQFRSTAAWVSKLKRLRLPPRDNKPWLAGQAGDRTLPMMQAER